MLDKTDILYYTLAMYGTDVEWDEDKNAINKREHEGLGFELAQFVFADPNRLERLDRSENNTSEEERWQTLGIAGRVLFVVYTERRKNKRIISARLADKAERRSYNGYYQIDSRGWAKAN
jgi:uncharacterized DUF497 family protein